MYFHRVPKCVLFDISSLVQTSSQWVNSNKVTWYCIKYEKNNTFKSGWLRRKTKKGSCRIYTLQLADTHAAVDVLEREMNDDSHEEWSTTSAMDSHPYNLSGGKIYGPRECFESLPNCDRQLPGLSPNAALILLFKGLFIAQPNQWQVGLGWNTPKLMPPEVVLVISLPGGGIHIEMEPKCFDLYSFIVIWKAFIMFIT